MLSIYGRQANGNGKFATKPSFDGIEYDIAEHELTADQVSVYDTYASAFKTVHANLDKALEATGIDDTDDSTQFGTSRTFDLFGSQNFKKQENYIVQFWPKLQALMTQHIMRLFVDAAEGVSTEPSSTDAAVRLKVNLRWTSGVTVFEPGRKRREKGVGPW